MPGSSMHLHFFLAGMNFAEHFQDSMLDDLLGWGRFPSVFKWSSLSPPRKLRWSKWISKEALECYWCKAWQQPAFTSRFSAGSRWRIFNLSTLGYTSTCLIENDREQYRCKQTCLIQRLILLQCLLIMLETGNSSFGLASCDVANGNRWVRAPTLGIHVATMAVARWNEASKTHFQTC